MTVREHGTRPAPSWRSIALPREHGGWGLTLEPVLLGLLVAWSVPGLLIGIATFAVFLARTPLKLAAVDARRRRWRERSSLALRIGIVELAVVVLLVAVVVTDAGWHWLVPVALAAPLVGIGLWYDVRSRSRRLLPELCDAVGIAATAAAIVLADRDEWALAVALWVILAGRSAGSIPFVRTQIARLHGRTANVRASDLAQMSAAAIAVVAVSVDHGVLLGALAIGMIAGLQVWSVRRPLRPITVIGVQQMALGLAVVTATAAGVHL